MRHYASYGFKRFVLCLGYRGEMIRDYFFNYHLHNQDVTLHMGSQDRRVVTHANDDLDWQVTFVDTGVGAQTGARIARVARYIDSPFFLCTYGDGVSDIDIDALVAFHTEHGRVATVSGVHPPARIWRDGDWRRRSRVRIPRKANARVTATRWHGLC